MAGLISKIKDSLKQGEENPSDFSKRFSGVERFLGKSFSGNGNFSWGLLLLSGFGVYAVINLVLSILYLF